jgi:hypothetical protein
MSLEVGLYDNDPDLTQFSQGDILRGIPFPRWPTFESANSQDKWGILRPLRSGRLASQSSMNVLPIQLEGRAQRSVPDAFSNLDRSERVIGYCQISDVLVLSRSCSLDNDRRKHLVVAPVIAIDTLPGTQRSEGKLVGLRNNDIPHYFYLPPTNGMTESFADFLLATSIHRSFLDENSVKDQLVARLSSLGTMRLQMKLSGHFGTQFGYDFEDICPKDGWYSCSACFHAGQKTEKLHFGAGEPFGKCSICGEQAAFVRVG